MSLTDYVIYGGTAAITGTVISTGINTLIHPLFKLFPDVGTNLFDDAATLLIAAATSSVGIYVGDKALAYIFNDGNWIQEDPTGGVFLLVTILLSNIHYGQRLRALSIDLSSYLANTMTSMGIDAFKAKRSKPIQQPSTKPAK